MDLGKALSDLAVAPLRIASAGLEIAGGALSSLQHALGDTTVGSPVMSMLGLDDTLSRAGRLTRLVDDDAPLGRALAPGGVLDRLLRPGGLVDQISQDGGILDRLTDEGGAVTRALAPGGVIDRLTLDADYFSDDAPTIVIDGGRQHSLNEIAESYFKRYTKARNGLTVIGERMELANAEIRAAEARLARIDEAIETGDEEYLTSLIEPPRKSKFSAKRRRQKLNSKEPDVSRLRTAMRSWSARRRKTMIS